MAKKNDYEQRFKKTFFIESRESLDLMEASLLSLEKDYNDEESVNAVFRAAHTIKGSSGMFGFTVIEGFTHLVENLLDQIRIAAIVLDPDLVGILLECRDHILDLLNFFEENEEATLDEEINTTSQKLIEKLNYYLASNKKQPDGDSTDEYETKDNDAIEETDMIVKNECWHISLRFGNDMFRNGMDPGSFIRFLGEQGDIVNIKTVYDNIPGGEEMAPELCYLGFEIDFKGLTEKKEIEDVFEFVIDDCNIHILPPGCNISGYVKLIEELPETPMRIGEMLIEIGTLTELELEEALRLQTELDKKVSDIESIASKSPVGELMVEKKMVQQPVLDAALEKQQTIRKRAEKDRGLIRIESEKLDHLINLIGELVITGSNVKQIAMSDEKIGLGKTVIDMSKLIEEIRDSTMNIRMIQIGETFNKFERVVRDLSREKGKEIDLVINGGDTELDKTLIDKISDPLIHLIRNSIDHGIDIPEKRKKKNKTDRGTINLNAYHETGSIVIEVKDDGDGLNRDNILAKAIELEFIKPDESISDYDLFQYIFEPGFSTAEKVTNISGRGVGMDVVKRNIESLRGTIVLESEKGLGTTVRIHLPLTLAIIDGFMVSVGDSYYVLPLDTVIECTEVLKDELDSKDGGNYLDLRGDVLPFMRLRQFFNEEGEEPGNPKVIVVEHGRKKAGLVVDSLMGELQTVIKPLGRIFSKLQWLSGSTILGTGEVAYILDVPKLIQKINEFEMKKVTVNEKTG